MVIDTETPDRLAHSAGSHRMRVSWGRLAWQGALALGLGALAVASVGVQPALIPSLYLAAVTGELCRRDAADHRLPNNLVLPALALCLAAVTAQWLAGGSIPLVALLAGAGYLLFLLGLNLGGGMGMGDVKLGTALGLALGLLGVWSAVSGLVIAFSIGGVGGLAFLLLRRTGAGSRIPFGPFLLAGYWIALGLSPFVDAQ